MTKLHVSFGSALVALWLLGLGCEVSNANGTPEDCSAAGGQCVGGGVPCQQEGPANTCNCNPTCNPGGFFCCISRADGGDAQVGH